jgi:hypothetical protein
LERDCARRELLFALAPDPEAEGTKRPMGGWSYRPTPAGPRSRLMGEEGLEVCLCARDAPGMGIAPLTMGSLEKGKVKTDPRPPSRGGAVIGPPS